MQKAMEWYRTSLLSACDEMEAPWDSRVLKSSLCMLLEDAARVALKDQLRDEAVGLTAELLDVLAPQQELDEGLKPLERKMRSYCKELGDELRKRR